MTVAKTPAEIEAEVLARFTMITGRTLLLADPVRLLLQSIIEYLSHLRTLIELADLRNLPFDADDAALDALGAFVGAARPAGEGSTTTVEYTRTVAAVELVIPAGHRVTTPDGAFLWALVDELTLAVGVFAGSGASSTVTWSVSGRASSADTSASTTLMTSAITAGSAESTSR